MCMYAIALMRDVLVSVWLPADSKHCHAFETSPTRWAEEIVGEVGVGPVILWSGILGWQAAV